ncbi:hypothetical protein OAS86_00705 [Gammaproteobacteria bacterium]|nr:hypothetical protein [Gammaproteobacteria bacterium]
MSRVLVCLYGAPCHRHLAEALLGGRVGDLLKQQAQICCVGHWQLDGLMSIADECLEGYVHLPHKTMTMIDQALQRFQFDVLLKIDVDIVVEPYFNRMDSAHEDRLLEWLSSPFEGPMDGLNLNRGARRDKVERWAASKQLAIDWDSLYGAALATLPPFYSGGAYRLSRDFATYVSHHGMADLQLSAAYHPAEDCMMARLLARWHGEATFGAA